MMERLFSFYVFQEQKKRYILDEKVHIFNQQLGFDKYRNTNIHIPMTQQTDSYKINEEKTNQPSNKKPSKEFQSKMSVLSPRYFNQTNSEYLNYCPTQQLIGRLEYKLTVLRFVFDLHQSIVIKEKQRYQRVGFTPLHINKQKTYHQDSINPNQDNYPNQINNQKLKSIIIDNLFYQDLNKMQIIKSKIQNQVKIITKHLYGRIRNNEKIDTKLQEIYRKVEKNRYMVQRQQTQIGLNEQQNKDSIERFINPKNFQSYIDPLYRYLLVKFGDINLYDLLKQLTQRWICDIHQQEEQRSFNLLNQINLNQIKQNKNSQQNANLSIRKQSANGEITQKNTIKLSHIQTPVYELVKQRQVHFQQQNKELAFLELLHQTKTQIRKNNLFQSAVVPIDNFNEPCCNTFLYKFSRIHSNKYSSNPKNDHLIFITKQSIGLQEFSHQSQKTFKTYEMSIKQATAALLNNNGGFIFVGFKKQGLYYSPQCPFFFNENSTKGIQEKIVEAVSKEITLLTGKNDKQQLPYKNIYVDFIPILKRRNDFIKEGNFANEGEFVWRIRIQPNNSSKLRIHSIMDTFYDLDDQNQSYLKLEDNNDNKDTVYNKLKSMLDYYEIQKSEQQSIFKYNPYRLISHNDPCEIPLCQTHFAKQQRQIHDSKKKHQQPIDQNKKNNQKHIQNIQTITTEESKRNIDSTQEQKVQFKQINLIVLQNKNIKESCQQYFNDKKIQVKIQKLENQSLKKLTKQTYIIYHHKKFDEINTQLSEFKKGFNSKKNISLISAEKSVSVDCSMDSNQLKEVQRMGKKHIQRFDDQKISYVEETKDNQSKSYLKAQNKKAGIYLYFILSELNLKAKMKNVPANLHNKLISLEEAIREKQSKEEKPAIKEATKNNNQNNNNKGQKNGNKSSNFNNQPYFQNQNQQQQIYQPYGYNQYQTQDPNYKLYQQKWLQYFISIYNQYVKMYGKEKGAEEFNKMLTSNSHEMYNFSYYQINSQPFFQQINQQLHKDYYNKVNYQNQSPQQPY